MSGLTHPVAAGFDRVAARYERGRPDYPKEAVRHLVEVLGLGPGRVAIDVGAGTGKFTRELRPSGAHLIAVEPLAGMRAEFAARVPGVPLLEGSAERLPLAGASADAVVSAQAFHWFDPARAAQEFARVLRPSGGIGLVWNARDERVPWVAELTRILDRHDAGGPRGRSEAWRAPLEGTGLFSPLQKATFPHVQRCPPETIVDRALSVSFIALLPPPAQAEVEAQVRDLLSRFPETRGRDLVELPYNTDVFWAARTPAARGGGPGAG